MNPHEFIPATTIEWQSYLLVILGAVLLAVNGVLNKKLLNKQAPATCVGAITFLGSGVLLLAAAMLFNPPQIWNWFDGRLGLFWPLAATCLLNIVIMYGPIWAMGKFGGNADNSLISPMSAVNPLISWLPSMLILGEVPHGWGLWGIILMGLGVYIFSFTEVVKVTKETVWQPSGWLKQLGPNARFFAPLQMLFKHRGVQLASLAAICGAVSVNFDKLSAHRSSYLFAAAIIMIFLGLVGAIRVQKTGEWKKVQKEHILHLVVNTIILAVVLACFWFAFHYGMAIYVSALKRTSVIFALLLSYFWLNEKNAIRRWPGGLIMAVAAILLSL